MCQLTACRPSSLMHKLIIASLAIISYLLKHIIFSLAREAGIEPTLTVLETALLPLEDSRKMSLLIVTAETFLIFETSECFLYRELILEYLCDLT